MERFTKVKNIGKGNMGTCALVRNNEDGRHYVIKQVDLAKLNKKERAQSLNEAKVLSVLRHPNVINYVDSFLARKTDHLCIVMEYADGGDLGIRIKQAHGVNFGEDQIVDWTIQIVLALIHIHSRHILHRDIKTQNVFMTSDGLCKIGDFGIARALESTVDHASTFVGTPYYLSPELILEKPYDMQSDVWAFGVCLYEMMALKHPFNAGDMKGLMQKILRVQYDPLPNVYSPELRGLVSRILVKEPSQRIKLTDILKVPFVAERIRKWMGGGVLPPRYLAALMRFKLLPGISESAVPANMSGQLPAIINLKHQGGTAALGGQQPPSNTNAGPLTARTNSTSGFVSNSGQQQNDDPFVSLASSSLSSHLPAQQAPFTSRPANPFQSGMNLQNNLQQQQQQHQQQLQQQQRPVGLPPLGPLGNNQQQLPVPLTQRKASFSFPAPPPISRQQQQPPQLVGGGNNSNFNNFSSNNPFSHNQNQAGAGLVRKPSNLAQPSKQQSTFPALPKLPGLPVLPPLGRPQPGSL